MIEHKKKFAKKLIIFLAVLLIVVLALNTFYYGLVSSKKMVNRKEKEYQEHFATSNYVKYGFFGSSHTLDAINPQYIDNSFNFASNGDNYFKIYYRLKRALDDDIKMDYVILETDLQTFSSLFDEPDNFLNDLFNLNNFVSYKELSKTSGKSIIEIFIRANFPFIGGGMDFFVNKTETPVSLGWARHEFNLSAYNNVSDVTLQRVSRHFDNKDLVSNLSFDYFKKTVSLAKENNIKVVFIKLPVSKEYDNVIILKKIDKSAYYNKIFNSVEDYIVLDYYTLFFDNSDYFRDPDHLNYVGAEVLSKKVSEDL